MDFTKLTLYMDSLSKTYGIPAADCIIMKEHQTVYRHSVGFSDYRKSIPVSDQDMYLLFSTSKIVTIIAVMQLIETGKLGFYDELTNYFPEFHHLKVVNHFDISSPQKWPDENAHCHIAANSIRIIDLMTMTAGLSYDMNSSVFKRIRDESHNQATTSQIVAAIADMPLVYDPRTRWMYGISHDILGGVVERVSDMPFQDYVKKHIFNPLGIKNMTYHPTAEQKKRLSALYRNEIKDGKLTNHFCPYPEGYNNNFFITENYDSGGAGLHGTVNEYILIADALAGYGVGANGVRILSESSVKHLMLPYTTGQIQNDFLHAGKGEDYAYGLGVRVRIDNSHSQASLGEFGWDGAGGAYVLIDPLKQISIFYIQHIFGFPQVYSDIHPLIRELTYEGLAN